MKVKSSLLKFFHFFIIYHFQTKICDLLQQRDIDIAVTEMNDLLNHMKTLFEELVLVTLPIIPRYPNLTPMVNLFNEHLRNYAKNHSMKLLDLDEAIINSDEECFQE